MIRPAARDRLIVALDVPTVEEARRLVGELGDSVGVYKVGLELLFAGGLGFVDELRGLDKRVFLDVKLLDIGNTVSRAIANVAELGVAFVTVHGHDVKTLRAAVAGRGASPLKILAVTVMTNLTADDLRQQGTTLSTAELALRRARMAHEAGCDGVIASGQEAAAIRAEIGPGFLIVTPGIRLPGSTSDDQSRIVTPERAIAEGADYLVVGRPITLSGEPRKVAILIASQIRQAHAAQGKRA
ncbi:MAG: orotidine-5'-phosphate decarboxylase [Hyphomicrobiaceae bacterium]|nr:orotidine-5'-phosphate decarboxylase [Hyphomicrobiaceae bacterium]